MIVYEPGMELKGLRRRELGRFLRRAMDAVGLDGEVSVLLTVDNVIRAMNRQYRHKNKATDVLSFPTEVEGTAGDLAISVETALKQAEEHRHSLEVEIKVLMLHGLLHLAGYDHEADDGAMRRKEMQLRRELSLREGLIERTQKRATGRRRA